MNNKIKILSLAIAGLVIAGCNDKNVDAEKTDVAKGGENVVSQEAVHVAEKKVAPAGFQLIEGKHYEKIDNPVTIDAYDGITLTEFFWLGCPHCQTLEPSVQGIKETIGQDQNIRVVKSAVPGSQRWNLDAVVFHTIKELGGTESQLSLMLKYYERERLQKNELPSLERIEELFVEMGFDRTKAMQIFNNQELMKGKLEAANAEYNKLNANGVPVLVVNGQYRVLFDEVKTQEDIVNIVKALGEK